MRLALLDCLWRGYNNNYSIGQRVFQDDVAMVAGFQLWIAQAKIAVILMDPIPQVDQLMKSSNNSFPVKQFIKP